MDSGAHKVTAGYLTHSWLSRKPEGLKLWAWALVIALAFSLGTTANSAPASSSIKLLPSVKTSCKNSSIRLAAGGDRSSSNIHLVCADRRWRIIYMRYSPRRGIVERVRVPGPKLSPWGDEGFSSSPYAIAHSGGSTYIAWGVGNEIGGQVYVVGRKGTGAWWRQRLITPSNAALDIELAGDSDNAYVAWTDAVCNIGSKEGCDLNRAYFSSVTASGSQTTRIDPGPAPCSNGELDGPATYSPAVAATSNGPVVAVTDSCHYLTEGGGLRVRLFSMPGGIVSELSSPPTLSGATHYTNPILTSTFQELFLTYRAGPGSGPSSARSPVKPRTVLLSVFSEGAWNNPSVIAAHAESRGYTAVAKGRIFVTYHRGAGTRNRVQVLFERTDTGWQRHDLPSRHYPGAIAAAGGRLYFDASSARLGRAVVHK